MVKHIVMFRLKGSDEERKNLAFKFRDALMALPSRIECLRSLEAAVNSNPSETWDIVLTAVVDNFEDLEKYATHPLHLAAADIIKNNKEDRACVDYEF